MQFLFTKILNVYIRDIYKEKNRKDITMSDAINSVHSDKSHLFGGHVGGAYMANNDNRDINLFKEKEHDVNLSGVSVWNHPQATA